MKTTEPARSKTSCCTPAIAGQTEEARPAGRWPDRGQGSAHHDSTQALVPGGTFLMGDASGQANPGDGETPVHEVALAAFEIDVTAVSNDQWARFAAATGYRTEAEQLGFSAVFHLAVETAHENTMRPVPDLHWWIGVRGADWAHPGGPGSTIEGLNDHPVVHVSWNDVRAYCEWTGRRLPTEAEWERASRGGIESAPYPWGAELVGRGGEKWRCNIWQGVFPRSNTLEDGWLTTAPVRSYEPNGFGLWQTVGNVWEWCSDWYSATYYATSPRQNPTGPTDGTQRTLRGGSYLCHDSYCNRYRNSARSSNTPDSSMGNTGFRTVGGDAATR